MEDEFLTRAQKQLNGISAQMAEMDELIERAETMRSKLREDQNVLEQAVAMYKKVMDIPTTPQEQLPLIGTLQGTVANMCAQVIEVRGGPVSVRELVQLLASAGKFKNPKNYRANYGTVFATLQRDERFRKTPGKGEFRLESVESDEPLFAAQASS